MRCASCFIAVRHWIGWSYVDAEVSQRQRTSSTNEETRGNALTSGWVIYATCPATHANKDCWIRFSDLICSYLVIILLLFYLWISSGWYPIYLMLCFQFPSSLFFVFKQYFMSLKGDILYSFSGSYWHRFRVYNFLILSSAAAPYSPSMWHCFSSCQFKKKFKKYTRGKQNGHQL